ncbi:MAG: hypothetical protein ACOYJO_02540 [Eubacterium sp.]|jgi:hypothetical protein
MRKELPYFNIDGEYGGDQDWFRDPSMRLGGCGAETACDLSIYLTLYKGRPLYPFDARSLTREDYCRFTKIMKPYLHPRFSGIDRLDIYTEGFGRFLEDSGENGVGLETLDGASTYAEAERAVRSSIDSGMPVVMLVLNHKDPAFRDYEWHWFILNGYDDGGAGSGGARGDSHLDARRTADAEDMGTAGGGSCIKSVKAVTYGSWEWLDFHALWDTGMTRRGGLVLPVLH